jgi:hypothetical protein
MPFQTLRGCTLAASDGEIGSVREFYFTDEQWKVRYLVVDTGSWLGGRRVLVVPAVLREVDPQSNVIVVDLTKEQCATRRHSIRTSLCRGSMRNNFIVTTRGIRIGQWRLLEQACGRRRSPASFFPQPCRKGYLQQQLARLHPPVETRAAEHLSMRRMRGRPWQLFCR